MIPWELEESGGRTGSRLGEGTAGDGERRMANTAEHSTARQHVSSNYIGIIRMEL